MDDAAGARLGCETRESRGVRRHELVPVSCGAFVQLLNVLGSECVQEVAEFGGFGAEDQLHGSCIEKVLTRVGPDQLAELVEAVDPCAVERIFRGRIFGDESRIHLDDVDVGQAEDRSPGEHLTDGALVRSRDLDVIHHDHVSSEE